MDFDFTTDTLTPISTTILGIGGTGALDIPAGSTAQRPASPTNGCIRYNTDLNAVEFYVVSTWITRAGNINGARVATTANISLTAPGATIDGVTMVAGDRVLVWTNTTASQNGVYTWNGAAVAMTRVTDMSSDWNTTVTGRNILVDQGTTYSQFTFFAVSPTGGTYDTTAMTWSGDFFQNGNILFGNSATVTRASTGGFGLRNFTLLDTNASLRTWRFVSSGSGNSSGLEMILGNNDDLANAANYWWDISTNSDSQEAVRIARRTGGVIAPKLIVDLNGQLTVGNTVLASGATGAAFASTAGVVTYFNSTDAIRIPTGTTAQRPATNTTGNYRFNTTTSRPEYYNGTTWITLGTSIVQIITGVFTPSTGTPGTVAAYDNSAPQSTEGTLVWTQAITPASTASRIKIDISTILGVGTGNAKAILSLFRGTTNIGTTVVDYQTGTVATSGVMPASFSLIDSPATAAAVTYTLRASATTGVYYFGRGTGTATLANAAAGNYTLMEIL